MILYGKLCYPYKNFIKKSNLLIKSQLLKK